MIKEFIRDKIITRNKMVHDIPRTINIELTNRCNLLCKMCPHSSMSGFGDMDFELFKKTINQVSDFADKNTSFMLVGLGEPLLYPKLVDAIMYIRENVPYSSISFATNGTLLSGSIAFTLCSFLKNNDGILVSLNTNDSKEYEWLMHSDKYDLVVANIKNALSFGGREVPITVQFMDTKNGEGIGKFKEYWQPYLKSKDRIFIRPLVNWNVKINMDSFPSQDKKERYPCLALWTSISIDRNGNIYPCCEAFSSRESSDLLFGNIKESSLLDAYEVNIILARKKHLESEWNDIPGCSRCDMWSASPNVWIKAGNRWF